MPAVGATARRAHSGRLATGYRQRVAHALHARARPVKPPGALQARPRETPRWNSPRPPLGLRQRHGNVPCPGGWPAIRQLYARSHCPGSARASPHVRLTSCGHVQPGRRQVARRSTKPMPRCSMRLAGWWGEPGGSSRLHRHGTAPHRATGDTTQPGLVRRRIPRRIPHLVSSCTTAGRATKGRISAH